ncbi:MAG: fumarylacetoacetate hydrolase family protein [Candidatus Zipacnadales bacterium]
MKIISFWRPDGRRRIAVIQGEICTDVTCRQIPDALALAWEAVRRGTSLTEVAAELADTYAARAFDMRADDPRVRMTRPIDPPEVWGAGITYQRTANRYDEDATETIYTRVYQAERPELFFKATAARCVGPSEPISIRADSRQTSAEPELAALLSPDGHIMALLCCNDVTARDIEYENPLYLPQAKIYAGSCAIGPALVTLDEVDNPQHLEITCIIERGNQRWEGRTNTSQMKRTVTELAAWLTRNNPIPVGTILTTGTGIVPPVEWCLREGDVVTVEIEGLGRLSNPVRQLV